MAVRTYFSTDPDAPVLNGLAGSLIAVLDACLVNGYGAKPPLGWTKEHAGQNKAAYRQVAKLGYRQYYLRVQDDAFDATQLGRTAKAHGYETMTSVDAGTMRFPPSNANYPDAFIRKSASADDTARPWLLVGDARTFYLVCYSGDSVYGSPGFMFGDFQSIVPGDTWNCIISGQYQAAGLGAFEAAFGYLIGAPGGSINQVTHLARTYDGANIPMGGLLQDARITNPQIGQGRLEFPTLTGAAVLGRIPVLEYPRNARFRVRGYLRGMWAWGHDRSLLSNWQQLEGSGELAGRTMLAATMTCMSNSYGVAVFETSDTWDL